MISDSLEAYSHDHVVFYKGWKKRIKYKRSC